MRKKIGCMQIDVFHCITEKWILTVNFHKEGWYIPHRVLKKGMYFVFAMHILGGIYIEISFD